MTFPRTSTELDWPVHAGTWVPGPAGMARVLDLRPADADPVPASAYPPLPSSIDWSDAASHLMAVKGIAAGTRPDDPDKPTDDRDSRTWLIALGRDDGTTGASIRVGILIDAPSVYGAQVTAAEHGILMPVGTWGDTRSRVHHLEQVVDALAEPNSWHPGLADADLRTDRAQQAALYDLLHLAHPRIPTFEAARPISILNTVTSSGILLEWLSSPHSLRTIADLSTYIAADDLDDWLDHVPSDILATWLAWGPFMGSDCAPGLAALHAAGWQPPTAQRAWRALFGDEHAENDVLIRVAAITALTPEQITSALRAGLTLTEIETLLGAHGPDGFDWDALAALHALRPALPTS